uniref:RING-type E3 ubiquitin transferase n=1 Tax=Timema bartmani TaxID=61472 RepID=A0A7R9F034_9NEOP|nr:unnamed protein product [Timema bartmani]
MSEVVPYSESPARLETSVMLGWSYRALQGCRLATTYLMTTYSAKLNIFISHFQVIYVQAFILVILMGKLMRKVFFGQLRAAEFEHLMERSWYAITETCLAFTVFRDDFSPKFVALFTVLLFLKSFHWLAEDRVDFMERSPDISWLFHIRVLSLLTLLGALDLHFVGHAYQSTVTKGASVQLVFGFEYAILLTIIVNISIKYALHTVDLNSENPWENKTVFLLYTELVMGFFKVILYIAFVAIMVRIYTLPLFAFRPMYYTMRAFKKAFNDVILSRRAIRNMNTLYPDATPEELAAADNVCIICREEMVTASKKLPCNHIFHTSCLRSWFQRQQTCPTCRLNILRPPVPPSQGPGPQPAVPAQPPPPPPAPAQPAAGAQIPPIGGANPFQPLMGGAGFPGPFPFWQPMPQPQQAPGVAARSNQIPQDQTPGQPATTTSPPTPGFNMAPPPFFCPPFPFMPPFSSVLPTIPGVNYSGLSVEELRRLEGNMRENVEGRIQCLKNIQALLDASVLLMQQYSLAAATSYSIMNISPTTQEGAAPNTNTIPVDQPHSTAATVPSTEEAANFTPLPSTSSTEASTSTNNISLASKSPSPPLTKEQEEIRRRRLQKFAQGQPVD